MTNSVAALPKKGRTYYEGNTPPLDANVGQSAKLEGLVKVFNDTDPTVTAGPKQTRSSRKVECMLVRNVSGETLAAKRVCTWAAGHRGKRVDGYCRLSAQEVAGVVDDAIGSAGVLDNDLFWLVRKGPCLCRTDVAALVSIAEGDLLIALTAVSSNVTTAGRVIAAVAGTTNVTYMVSNAVNRLGRAISAKVTANTNSDILVDLEILSVA